MGETWHGRVREGFPGAGMPVDYDGATGTWSSAGRPLTPQKIAAGGRDPLGPDGTNLVAFKGEVAAAQGHGVPDREGLQEHGVVGVEGGDPEEPPLADAQAAAPLEPGFLGHARPSRETAVGGA